MENMKLVKIVAVKFFFVGDSEMHSIDFDTWSECAEWETAMGNSIEIFSTKQDYRVDFI